MNLPWNPPWLAPIHILGKEPLPPGLSESDREQFAYNAKIQRYIQRGQESCVFKAGLAGVGGFGIGCFLSLMQASFAYEDPILREQKSRTQRARDIFKEMGSGMWRTGKSLGRVGMLFAGIECVFEGYRAKNDMVNPIAAGFVAGGILARASGPKAMMGGGLAFAAFSTAIELFLRREEPDEP